MRTLGALRRKRRDRALARRIGQEIGAILAEQQHASCVTAPWLPRRPPWPEPAEIVLPRLHEIVDDADLLRAMERVIRHHEAEDRPSVDRVLVHGDLGFHNIALDPALDTVAGVFDYADASWSDRHQDFRYLVFPAETTEQPVLEAALEVDEPARGLRLDSTCIRLCNAACAIGFLAHRQGALPDARSCGRTLADDLEHFPSQLARE